MPLSYAPGWLYHAPAAWAHEPDSTFVRGIRPQILDLELSPITLPLPPIGGPPSLGAPALPRVFNTFNPAIAAAPPDLCPRCAYVVALRVDPLHQCNLSSPLMSPFNGKIVATGAWFKGTALAVYDVDLVMLGWTWLLPRPEDQVSIAHNRSRWYVPPGVHDDFTPPWTSEPTLHTSHFTLHTSHFTLHTSHPTKPTSNSPRAALILMIPSQGVCV